MPTVTMKLFSLLMGNSAPVVPEDTIEEVQPDLKPQPEEPEPVPVVPPPSPPTINWERLRKIFKALSSQDDQDDDPEAKSIRKKHLGLFDRKFGFKSRPVTPNGVDKSHSNHRILRVISSKLAHNRDTSKDQTSWARERLNRITTSMRRVRSDSFIAKRVRRRRRSAERARDNRQSEFDIPSMKTKKRSTIEHSRNMITGASQLAHKDLVQHLEKTSTEHCIDDLELWNYDYPFENLVFEGGGAKVHTYIGAIRCLEEAGIKPKRLAGTSAGAMTAGLLAVGYTSEEIHILYEYDVEYTVKDGTCGLLSLLPNMFRHYGWNPGERAMKWYGECLAVKTGNPDITFQQIYEQYGTELCIVAVNLSTRCEEYFHPKTTPDMPVKLAVRMSSSMPGLFQPVRRRMAGGVGTNVYVDGGLLCNFPVHVFDGWWLSMEPDDVFYKKMGSLENLPQIMERTNRFGEYNAKTLGFCMFSMFDDKALRFELEKRHKLQVPKRPNTKLVSKRKKMMKRRYEREADRDTKLDALNRFFRVLRNCHLEQQALKKEVLVETFDRLLSEPPNIEDAGDKTTFNQTHANIIFGERTDWKELFKDLQAGNDNEVSSSELMMFLKRQNVDIQELLGAQILGRVEVSNFGHFFMTIQESLMNSARRVYIQTQDLNRTVGINTDYIKMDDFNLEKADQEFLIKQGYTATAAFLRYWIHQHDVHPNKHGEKTVEDSDSLNSLTSTDNEDDLYLEVGEEVTSDPEIQNVSPDETDLTLSKQEPIFTEEKRNPDEEIVVVEVLEPLTVSAESGDE